MLSMTLSLLVRALIILQLSIFTDNPNYDNLEGCYDWAKETLRVHSSDPRQFVYTLQQLEDAHTHDDLWNAAQIQMTTTGKMHVRSLWLYDVHYISKYMHMYGCVRRRECT